MSQTVDAILSVAHKHLSGQHNQKRHGFRMTKGSVDKALVRARSQGGKEASELMKRVGKTGYIPYHLLRNNSVRLTKNEFNSLVSGLDSYSKSHAKSGFGQGYSELARKTYAQYSQKEIESSVAHKHLSGQHNQKRHGWRYGGVAQARRSMRGQDEGERGEYRKRAGMPTPTKKPKVEGKKSLSDKEIEKTLTDKGGRLWEKNNMKRVYFNASTVASHGGLKWSKYNTGNIRSATLNGDYISNSKASSALYTLNTGKLFYDFSTKSFHKQSINKGSVANDLADTFIETAKGWIS